MSQKAIVIGSGFSGLATATTLAHAGLEVTILEKNEDLGGRARQFKAEGFTYDMGPSWYWMPEVFEQYFNRFGKTTSNYYDLIRLDPSYQVIFDRSEKIQVPADKGALVNLFESIEPGAGLQLTQFLQEAAYKYEVGLKDFVWKPSHSAFEYFDWRILQSLFKLEMFSSLTSAVKRRFKDPRLIQILEFPVLFLGAKPSDTPALYSLMNHADLEKGTWYPQGGMHKIVEAMVALAKEKGVEMYTSQEVEKIEVLNGKVAGVHSCGRFWQADVVIASADYHHVDQNLLPEHYRHYSPKYWNSRVLAPSSLLYYLGVDKKINNLLHHNLFFDADFNQHARDIYDNPTWPENPLFYVSAPSVTDPTVAPVGQENLFLLMPLAPGMSDDTEAKREEYFGKMMDRLEGFTGQEIRPHICYKRSYAHQEFKADYHSFKGNAYGLANTLLQTGFLKPKMRSNKLSNLWYTGQLTVPGPGVPPSLISGQMVAQEILHQIPSYTKTVLV